MHAVACCAVVGFANRVRGERNRLGRHRQCADGVATAGQRVVAVIRAGQRGDLCVVVTGCSAVSQRDHVAGAGLIHGYRAGQNVACHHAVQARCAGCCRGAVDGTCVIHQPVHRFGGNRAGGAGERVARQIVISRRHAGERESREIPTSVRRTDIFVSKRTAAVDRHIVAADLVAHGGCTGH